MAANPVVFWELATHDQDKSAKFFRDVFGWEVILDPELGFYRVNPPAGKNAAHGYIFTPKRPFCRSSRSTSRSRISAPCATEWSSTAGTSRWSRRSLHPAHSSACSMNRRA